MGDGNRESRDLLAVDLIRSGYAIIQTGDGIEALRLARAEQPDLIVLDIALPNLDGLTLCHTLHSEQDAPIVILTSRRDSTDVIAALDNGAEDCLTKPFAPGEFPARLQAVLKRRGKTLAPKLQAGDLTLDLVSRRAFCRDMLLNLSRKEFDLLAEFVRHPGAVLRREALISRVWGESPKTRTLDTHIYWLREKIEENPTRPQRIRTIRGIGYRFDA